VSSCITCHTASTSTMLVLGLPTITNRQRVTGGGTKIAYDWGLQQYLIFCVGAAGCASALGPSKAATATITYRMPSLKNFIAPQPSTSTGSIVLIRLHVEHFWSTPNSRSLDEPAFRGYGLEVEMALATTHRLALENTSVTGLGAPAVPRAAYPDLIATRRYPRRHGRLRPVR
jgi:hypothetical protein